MNFFIVSTSHSHQQFILSKQYSIHKQYQYNITNNFKNTLSNSNQTTLNQNKQSKQYKQHFNITQQYYQIPIHHTQHLTTFIHTVIRQLSHKNNQTFKSNSTLHNITQLIVQILQKQIFSIDLFKILIQNIYHQSQLLNKFIIYQKQMHAIFQMNQNYLSQQSLYYNNSLDIQQSHQQPQQQTTNLYQSITQFNSNQQINISNFPQNAQSFIRSIENIQNINRAVNIENIQDNIENNIEYNNNKYQQEEHLQNYQLSLLGRGKLLSDDIKNQYFYQIDYQNPRTFERQQINLQDLNNQITSQRNINIIENQDLISQKTFKLNPRKEQEKMFSQFSKNQALVDCINQNKLIEQSKLTKITQGSKKSIFSQIQYDIQKQQTRQQEQIQQNKDNQQDKFSQKTKKPYGKKINPLGYKPKISNFSFKTLNSNQFTQSSPVETRKNEDMGQNNNSYVDDIDQYSLINNKSIISSPLKTSKVNSNSDLLSPKSIKSIKSKKSMFGQKQKQNELQKSDELKDLKKKVKPSVLNDTSISNIKQIIIKQRQQDIKRCIQKKTCLQQKPIKCVDYQQQLKNIRLRHKLNCKKIYNNHNKLNKLN